MTAEAAPRPRLGDVLKNMRHQSRMSMAAICAHAGVSEIEIAAYENGSAVPPWEVVESYLTAVRASHTTRTNLKSSWSAELQRAKTAPVGRRADEAGSSLNPASRRARNATERELDYLRENGVENPERFVLARGTKHTDGQTSLNRHLSSTACETPADTSLWPAPDTIMSVPQFVAAWSAIRNSSGLTFVQLSEATRATHYCSTGWLSVACNPAKNKLPRHGGRVVAFIVGCGGSFELAAAWFRTWQKLIQLESVALMPADEDLQADSDQQAEPADPVFPPSRIPRHLKRMLIYLVIMGAGVLIGAVIF